MVLQDTRLALTADTATAHDVEVEHHDVENEQGNPLQA